MLSALHSCTVRRREGMEGHSSTSTSPPTSKASTWNSSMAVRSQGTVIASPSSEALLVGRYLKENGFSKTLQCFLKETPIRQVPQFSLTITMFLQFQWSHLEVERKNMLSLTEILKCFNYLLKLKEEFDDQNNRIQQYEEILNFVLDELRDVYTFHSSPGNHDAHFQNSVESQQEDSTPIEDYLHNSGETIHLISPDLTKTNMKSAPANEGCEALDKIEGLNGNSTDCSGVGSNEVAAFFHQQAQNEEIRDKHLAHRYTLEYYCNHSHQRQAHDGWSRHHVPTESTSPSGFVAYSSLLVKCSGSCANAAKLCADVEQCKWSNAKLPVGVKIGHRPFARDRHCCQGTLPSFASSSEDQSKHSRNSQRRPDMAECSGACLDASSGCMQEASARSSADEHHSSRLTRNPSPPKVDQGNSISFHQSCSSQHHLRTLPRHPGCGMSSILARPVVDSGNVVASSIEVPCTLQHQCVRLSRGDNDYIHHPQKQQQLHAQHDGILDNDNNGSGTYDHHHCYHCAPDAVDPTSLAAETASLLERLLPLISEPASMKDFINKLHTLSPNTTPRDHESEEWTSMICHGPVAGSYRDDGNTSTTLELNDSKMLEELEESVA